MNVMTVLGKSWIDDAVGSTLFSVGEHVMVFRIRRRNLVG
jgi:hypothetical protein